MGRYKMCIIPGCHRRAMQHHNGHKNNWLVGRRSWCQYHFRGKGKAEKDKFKEEQLNGK